MLDFFSQIKSGLEALSKRRNKEDLRALDGHFQTVLMFWHFISEGCQQKQPKWVACILGEKKLFTVEERWKENTKN